MSNIKSHTTSFILAITMFLSINNHCYAQNTYAVGNIDKDSISVGQTFKYKLDVRIPKDYVIDWSNLKDTLSKSVEVINRGDISTTPINNGDEIIVSQELSLTSFDTGYIEIPRLEIKYLKSSDDSTFHTCYTEYMDIYVKPTSIDTTMAFKPIKMPIKQSITLEETLPYTGGLIFLAALVLLIMYLIKRSKSKEKVEIVKEQLKIPAIITAREKLLQLKESNLSQSGKSKEFYTDLTDIAREYLNGQFNIEAIEMTSDEILDEVRKLNIDNIIFNKLQNTLITADLVKFAKANPDNYQNEAAFNDINSFVEESYIFHQETEKKKAEEAKAKKYDFEKETTENQEMEETK